MNFVARKNNDNTEGPTAIKPRRRPTAQNTDITSRRRFIFGISANRPKTDRTGPAPEIGCPTYTAVRAALRATRQGMVEGRAAVARNANPKTRSRTPALHYAGSTATMSTQIGGAPTRRPQRRGIEAAPHPEGPRDAHRRSQRRHMQTYSPAMG